MKLPSILVPILSVALCVSVVASPALPAAGVSQLPAVEASVTALDVAISVKGTATTAASAYPLSAPVPLPMGQ